MSEERARPAAEGAAPNSPSARIAGTIFSIAGQGIQWENTGAGYLAFEWFLTNISSNSSVTADLCGPYVNASNVTAASVSRLCTIARTRDSLVTSMVALAKQRVYILRESLDEAYEGIPASLRLRGAPTGFGCAASVP